ncbi:MAG TPA: glycosyl hydrolase family 18 protein [Patescibacteria group bacterium]|nr:glycosyl hydrolase family 18 protein [Patescibacteria group bacterium]
MAQPGSASRRRLQTVLGLALGLLLVAPAGTFAGTARSALAAPAPIVEGAALQPSVQYRQAVEHAGDRIDFEPGGLVGIPFRPRAEDDWQVDGARARTLPSGAATGAQIRAAPDGRTWAARAPEDVAAPWHFTGSRGASDALTAATPTVLGDVVPARAAVEPPAGVEVSAPVGASGLRREVFGFLPYWEVADARTVLDWRTLSTIAYFSVGCASNGNLLKRNADGSATTGWAGWTSSRMTSIINAAHQHQTRVVLTITCFAWSTAGAQAQAALLGSATARSNLARQVAAAVRDRGADGVNLDFEPIVAGYADAFTKLVRSIRAELNAIAPGYQLTFDAMGSVGDQPIAAATAPGGADAVLIMGYDYRTASASVAGSISPLSGPAYDLSDTIKAFTAETSPSKLILGLPWYGRAWSTPTDDPHARNISGTKYGAVAEPSYAQAVDLFAAFGRRWDAVEQSPWTAYRKQTCTAANGCVTSWRELYVDDATSLRLRYDLVNRASLRGAGIWALGYDGAHAELRLALADKFLADRTPPLTGIVTLPARQRDEGFRVAWTSYDDSAIRGYDVQVSIDGGRWTTWLAATTATSAVYLGANGRTYAFRVRATDVLGNVSAWRSVPLGSPGTPRAIAVGGFAAVVTEGLRLREAPTTAADVMTTFHAGDALQVIGGPVSARGFTWYQVDGPVRQWAPVEGVQVGGWVAAFGNGVTNVAPRSPVYATRVDAGITGLRLNSGRDRVLTPNGDGVSDELQLTWTNRRDLDSLALRIFRSNGTLAGSVGFGAGKLPEGPHAFDWDGRIAGRRLAAGTYLVQLRGTVGATTYSAASASPVSAAQLSRWGVVIANAAPTSVVSLRSLPGSPTRSRTVTYSVTFGGPVKYLEPDDIGRSGTATGCSIGRPTGAGAAWTFPVTGCSTGTLAISIRAGAVMDAVSNWGPEHRVSGPTLVIDRRAPSATAPRVSLRSGVGLASISASTGVLATLAWSGSDTGGAGVATYDVRRSRDGGPFADLATGLTGTALAVSLAPGHTDRFEVRARDRAGNVGGWIAGATLRPSLLQQSSPTIAYGGAWRIGQSDHYSAGFDRFATEPGASARLAFTGRGIAFVTTRGPDRGAVKVFLDGALVATIDTHASQLAFRSVAWSRTWAGIGTHTLKLVVVGSASHPRVDLDAFEILR